MEKKQRHQSRKAKSLGRHIFSAELTFWVVWQICGGNMLNLFNSLLNLFMPIKSQKVWFWPQPLQVPLVSNEVYLQDILFILHSEPLQSQGIQIWVIMIWSQLKEIDHNKVGHIQKIWTKLLFFSNTEPTTLISKVKRLIHYSYPILGARTASFDIIGHQTRNSEWMKFFNDSLTLKFLSKRI
jgi:hypothetical protein